MLIVLKFLYVFFSLTVCKLSSSNWKTFDSALFANIKFLNQFKTSKQNIIKVLRILCKLIYWIETLWGKLPFADFLPPRALKSRWAPRCCILGVPSWSTSSSSSCTEGASNVSSLQGAKTGVSDSAFCSTTGWIGRLVGQGDQTGRLYRSDRSVRAVRPVLLADQRTWPATPCSEGWWGIC